jgi:CMP-N,N'-diacetyllegionaminic acid synthase
MNIVAVIPARGGSKGIPRKNLIDFCGKPLLVWSIQQAKGSRHVREVFVSSDDAGILAVAAKAGAGTIVRPKNISGDKASSEAALLHALKEIEQRQGKPVDLLVFLQATSPLRTSADIDGAVAALIAQKADSLFSASRLEDFCLWQKKGAGFDSVTFDYRNRGRRQDREPLFLENGSIYVFKPAILARFGNRLGGKIATYLMPFWQSQEIDEPGDLELCRYYMTHKILGSERKGTGQ